MPGARYSILLESVLSPCLPGKRSLVLTPSCFLVESNTTVLAGIFTPMANVSVANNNYREKRNSNRRI